jgi:hypothetical protein
MTSSIVKGMPYGTMIYDQVSMKDENGDTLLPTIASQIGFLTNPVADGTNELKCDATGSRTYQVDKEVQAVFGESDFTWIVFFSAPVTLRCVASEGGPGAGAVLQVVDTEAGSNEPLVVRIALLKSCTSGNSPIYCHPEVMHPSALLLGQGEYEAILRNHSNLYPGPNTEFRFDVDNNDGVIRMSIDWDVQKMRSDTNEDEGSGGTSSNQLIAYGLPHHFKTLANNRFFVSQMYCTSSLVGPACLVDGNVWNFTEQLPALELRAPRPPAPWVLGPLAESLRRDLSFKLPSYYAHGAGDTYFSGKRLAKLARILVIAEEVREVCQHPDPSPEYEKECHHVEVPTESEMEAAVNRLRSYTEVWLNGTAAIPFVYDSYCTYPTAINWSLTNGLPSYRWSNPIFPFVYRPYREGRRQLRMLLRWEEVLERLSGMSHVYRPRARFRERCVVV